MESCKEPNAVTKQRSLAPSLIRVCIFLHTWRKCPYRSELLHVHVQAFMRDCVQRHQSPMAKLGMLMAILLGMLVATRQCPRCSNGCPPDQGCITPVAPQLSHAYAHGYKDEEDTSAMPNSGLFSQKEWCNLSSNTSTRCLRLWHCPLHFHPMLPIQTPLSTPVLFQGFLQPSLGSFCPSESIT